MEEILSVDKSYFIVQARGGEASGTLQVTAIAATIDHGDEENITQFVEQQMKNPVVASLLAGGKMCWMSNGIIALLLKDDEDLKQPLMRDFLFLSMLSGRFHVSHETQKLIWTDPVTKQAPPYPIVPSEWSELVRRKQAPSSEHFFEWYQQWMMKQ